MHLLLPAVLLVPLLAATVAAVVGRSHARAASGTVRAATALAFGGSVALAVHVATAGPVATSLGAGDGTSPLLVADRLGVTLLLLITGLSAVISAFAARYLAGDAAAHRFFAAAGLLAAATATAATAATLVGFAVAWTLSGVALCLLVGTYARLPAAREGVRRTA